MNIVSHFTISETKRPHSPHEVKHHCLLGISYWAAVTSVCGNLVVTPSDNSWSTPQGCPVQAASLLGPLSVNFHLKKGPAQLFTEPLNALAASVRTQQGFFLPFSPNAAFEPRFSLAILSTLLGPIVLKRWPDDHVGWKRCMSLSFCQNASDRVWFHFYSKLRINSLCFKNLVGLHL